MSAKNNIPNWKQWLDYLRSLITGKERNAFERELEKDEFSREATEGFESYDPDLLERDMQELRQRIHKRVHKPRRLIYIRIAATLALILSLGFAWIAIFDTRVPGFFGNTTVSEKVEEPVEAERAGEPGSEQNKESQENLGETGVEDSLSLENRDASPQGTRDEVPTKESQLGRQIAKPMETETIRKTETFQLTEEQSAEISQSVPEEIADEAKREIQSPPDIYRNIPQHEVSAAKKSGDDSLDEFQRQLTRNALSGRASGVRVQDTPASRSEQNLIRGRVISAEDKLPVPGATILVSGTTQGTVSDMDGRFSLKVEDSSKVDLTTRFIGMSDASITASGGSDVEIQLEPDVASLDEVVVVGYGTTRKDDLTGAVEVLDMDPENKGSDYTQPYPVGGYTAFREYIKESLNYPGSIDDRTREVVVLRFLVSDQSRPTNIEVLRSPGKLFSDEAIRLLEEGPDWHKASMGGTVLGDVSVKVRIVFRKED